jgi:mono/diheme cytochrome c family protein
MNGRPALWLVVAALAAGSLGGCGDDHIDDRPGDPVEGRILVTETVEPSCEACHTLAAADFDGTIGPDLDRLRPGYATVLEALRTGPGAMPDYSDHLDARALHDIAAYVSGAAAAGGGR